MNTFRIGDQGEAVAAIQQALKAQGHYLGPIDGRFGGGTLAAVKAFQTAKRLDVDGLVGDQTWPALFGRQEPAPASPLLARPLDERCLALTGSFETGAGFPDCFAGLSGNFDGQGLSLGVLQWNFGQGSLQPLLAEALVECRDVMADVFHDRLKVIEAVLKGSREEQVAFAKSLQDARGRIFEPWRGMLKALCRTEPFQHIQMRHAARRFDRAKGLADRFGLVSDRAQALMFGIVVQNGGIPVVVQETIFAEFAALPAGGADGAHEQARMRIVAARRAEAAKPEWMADVLARKLCIAEGSGRVHGIDYDLAAQFGLTLAPLDR